MTPQRIILFFVGGGIGGFGLLAAGEWIRPLPAVAQTPETQPGPNILNNQGIITNNQSGGTNQIINQEIPAQVQFIQPVITNRLPDGGSTFIYRARVTKPVARLHIQAQGNNVTNLSIRQDGPTSNKSDVQQYTLELPSGVRVIEETFSSAFGNYIITVNTNDGLPPMLAHKIQ